MKHGNWGIALVALWMASLCVTAHADYTELTLPDLNADIRTWTNGSVYNSLFPGDVTWNGVPFTLAEDGAGNTAWMKDDTAPESLDITVDVFGVTDAYTIINSAWGSYGTTDGYVEFFGSDGAYYSAPLVQGTNLRDHNNGGFNNTIDGVNAVTAFDGGAARLDMQLYTLPATFADETLETIRFTSGATSGSGVPFIAAATVETAGEPEPEPAIPAPGALLLTALGAGLLGAWRQRRTL
jgi:MYXO-CTERM domain-containing protein